MSEAIIVALITGGLALIGTLYSAKRTNDKVVAQLEKNSELSDAKLKGEILVINQQIASLTDEVKKHNNFATRIPVLEEKISDANHRINELRDRQNC